MGRRSSKEAILDAAQRVIKRQGMANTTVEAVAAEAGITKGGFFYHFPSKKELLLELLERYEHRFTALAREIYDSLPEGPGRKLKATVLALVRDPEKKDANLSNIITLLDDIEMREKIFSQRRRMFEELCEGAAKPEKIILALLATDGLWIADQFGPNSFSPEMQDRIIAELLRLIDVEYHPGA